jgi:hypothetical protein
MKTILFDENTKIASFFTPDVDLLLLATLFIMFAVAYGKHVEAFYRKKSKAIVESAFINDNKQRQFCRRNTEPILRRPSI